MKRFNTTGLCVPHKHYMVNIDERVQQIRAMVDRGDYFSINRGRQYGKTTTLVALERALSDDYGVISLDFQAISTVGFSTEGRFVTALSRILWRKRARFNMPAKIQEDIKALSRADEDKASLDQLFFVLSDWCDESDKPLVLIIDEKLVGHEFENRAKAWTRRGVDEAVRHLTSETNTLFDSLMGKLQNYPSLRKRVRALPMRGEQVAYVPDDYEQQQLLLYGFARVEHNKLVVANRVFEMRLYVF